MCRVLCVAAIVALPSTLIAQDCDGDGVPDSAQLGPFAGAVGGVRLELNPQEAPGVFCGGSDLFFNQGFTVELWVHRDARTGTDEYALHYGNGSAPSGLTMGFLRDDRFTVISEGDALTTAGRYPPGAGWEHWAITWDPQNFERKLYRNGQLVASDVSENFPNDIGGQVALGGTEVGTGSMHGWVDELRFWEVVRTEVEIQADMSRSFPIDALPSGLAAYYPMDHPDGEPWFFEPVLGEYSHALRTGWTTRLVDYSRDCNGNGVPDSCDPDSNGDGIPDDCQCLADFNGDGSINTQDVLSFLNAWIAGC